jgi:hypothetical protein
MPDKTQKASAAKSRDAKTAAPNADANEGEGSQTGAREYNEATHAFVASGKVNEAAQKAAEAVSGPEAESLRRAEEEGKRHSHGEDPALREPKRP